MKSKTIQLDEHEVVVDRLWLEHVGNELIKAGNKKLGNEVIQTSEYPTDDDEGSTRTRGN
jgi:hypothetical protein